MPGIKNKVVQAVSDLISRVYYKTNPVSRQRQLQEQLAREQQARQTDKILHEKELDERNKKIGGLQEMIGYHLSQTEFVRAQLAQSQRQLEQARRYSLPALATKLTSKTKRPFLIVGEREIIVYASKGLEYLVGNSFQGLLHESNYLNDNHPYGNNLKIRNEVYRFSKHVHLGFKIIGLHKYTSELEKELDERNHEAQSRLLAFGQRILAKKLQGIQP